MRARLTSAICYICAASTSSLLFSDLLNMQVGYTRCFFVVTLYNKLLSRRRFLYVCRRVSLNLRNSRERIANQVKFDVYIITISDFLIESNVNVMSQSVLSQRSIFQGKRSNQQPKSCGVSAEKKPACTLLSYVFFFFAYISALREVLR